MLRAPLRTAYRRLGGARYVRWAVVGQFGLSYLAVLGGLGLLKLYVGDELPWDRFVWVLAVAEVLMTIEIAGASFVALRLAPPGAALARGRSLAGRHGRRLAGPGRAPAGVRPVRPRRGPPS